jgi:hypothetical protein
MTGKLVAIDLSRGYLLARHSYEARLVLGDTWLSEERRVRAAAIYVEIGQDFNDFFLRLRILPTNLWYRASVNALEAFRDNLDILWMYAYSGNMREIVWLNK